MKTVFRAVALAAVVAALATTVGGREAPSPDDLEFEGIEAGADIGEAAMMAATAMVEEACKGMLDLGKVWNSKNLAYSQAVTDWYGECDKVQNAWDAAWAEVRKLAKQSMKGGADWDMPAPWLTWERAHRQFFGQMRSKGMAALLYYRGVQRRTADMAENLENHFARSLELKKDVEKISFTITKIRAAITSYDNGRMSKDRLEAMGPELTEAETLANVAQTNALAVQESLKTFFNHTKHQPVPTANEHKKLLQTWADEAGKISILEDFFSDTPYTLSDATKEFCTTKYETAFNEYRIAMVGFVDGTLFQDIRHFEMVKFEHLKSTVNSVRILFDNRVD
jgi:hypothetical protein